MHRCLINPWAGQHGQRCSPSVSDGCTRVFAHTHTCTHMLIRPFGSQRGLLAEQGHRPASERDRESRVQRGEGAVLPYKRLQSPLSPSGPPCLSPEVAGGRVPGPFLLPGTGPPWAEQPLYSTPVLQTSELLGELVHTTLPRPHRAAENQACTQPGEDRRGLKKGSGPKGALTQTAKPLEPPGMCALAHLRQRESSFTLPFCNPWKIHLLIYKYSRGRILACSVLGAVSITLTLTQKRKISARCS